eukprot:1124446-Pleurochrysis_carterae.AAC.5
MLCLPKHPGNELSEPCKVMLHARGNAKEPVTARDSGKAMPKSQMVGIRPSSSMSCNHSLLKSA